MKRDALGDLAAFLAVAEAKSFTRAAARLGTTQSVLSHTVRRLEERLGLRLLQRTTRSGAPTEAGQRLIGSVRPAFEQIERDVAALGELRDRPAGTIRLNTTENAATTLLLPALATFLPAYPDVRVELTIDPALRDIVAEGFDAGVRLGELVAKDMVATRIGPDIRMAVVGSPAYFARRPPPLAPKDLAEHACINLRLPTHGGVYVWDFERDGQEVKVRVDGQMVVNTSDLIVKAATAGLGLGFLVEDQVRAELADGRLVRVLSGWCPAFPGYHIYYPNRRRHASAFVLLVEALRFRSR